MWEEGGQCIQAVSRPGGLTMSCLFRAGEVHAALLGGSRREAEASGAASLFTGEQKNHAPRQLGQEGPHG